MIKKIGLLAMMFYASTLFAGNSNNENFDVKAANEGWFIGAGIGGQFYAGEGTRSLSAGDMISLGVDGNIGKWITPTIATRLQGSLKHATMGDSNGEKFSMNITDFHIDFMLDAINLFKGVNEERKFTAIPFIGFGCATNHTIDKSCFSFNLGGIALYRINRHINLFGELKGTLLSDKMDGIKSGVKADGDLMLSVGFNYNF